MEKIILKKKKSKYSIEFVVNTTMNDKKDPDWFIDENTVSGKKITHTSTIIKKDLDKVIKFYEGQGYIKQ